MLPTVRNASKERGDSGTPALHGTCMHGMHNAFVDTTDIQGTHRDRCRVRQATDARATAAQDNGYESHQAPRDPGPTYNQQKREVSIHRRLDRHRTGIRHVRGSRAPPQRLLRRGLHRPVGNLASCVAHDYPRHLRSAYIPCRVARSATWPCRRCRLFTDRTS